MVEITYVYVDAVLGFYGYFFFFFFFYCLVGCLSMTDTCWGFLLLSLLLFVVCLFVVVVVLVSYMHVFCIFVFASVQLT